MTPETPASAEVRVRHAELELGEGVVVEDRLRVEDVERVDN